jgi:ElaB/YqjD/DUF883 family membrane-anchored ribosome-binding protein
MNTQTTTTVNETNDKVKKAFSAVGEIAEAGLDLGLLKKKIETAVDEAVIDAERLARRGRHAFEDAVDDSTHYIKKNPWQSVGYAAGAGLGVGLLLGIVIARPHGNH